MRERKRSAYSALTDGVVHESVWNFFRLFTCGVLIIGIVRMDRTAAIPLIFLLQIFKNARTGCPKALNEK